MKSYMSRDWLKEIWKRISSLLMKEIVEKESKIEDRLFVFLIFLYFI